MKTKHLISAVCGTILKVVFTIIVAMVIYRGAITAYDYGYRVFSEPPVAAGEGRLITVTVTEDMSPTEMGNMMASKGLVRDAKLFAVQYLVSEFREDVAPGTYELSTAMTAEKMFEVMAKPVEEKKTGGDGNSAPGSNEDSSSSSGEGSGEDSTENGEGE